MHFYVKMGRIRFRDCTHFKLSTISLAQIMKKYQPFRPNRQQKTDGAGSKNPFSKFKVVLVFSYTEADIKSPQVF